MRDRSRVRAERSVAVRGEKVRTPDRSDWAMADVLVEILLDVHWSRREEIMAIVRSNPFFCTVCGVGSREEPNPNCYCERDD